MISFIIYEDSEITRKGYVNLINKFMGKSDNLYKILEFSAYTNDLKEFICNGSGHKIYILDIDVPGKSGLDLAREIRSSRDVESHLIVVTGHKELLDNTFVNRSLVLNFISKFDDCDENLLSVLQDAYKNISKHKSFVFKYDGDVYRIPFDEILYFETDPVLGQTNIVTRKKCYVVKKTLAKILTELNDHRFMKSHKSYIVNLYNIERVNMTELLIYFTNYEETILLSRNYKKAIQEKLKKQV